MMSFARLGRKALAPAGGAATMATIWMGEQSSAKMSSRVSNKAAEALICRNGNSSYAWNYRRAVAFSSESAGKTAANTSKTTLEQNTTAAAASAAKKQGSFVEWYEGHLNTRPVVTKMFTGFCLWGLGDAVAQIVPQITPGDEGDEKATTKTLLDYDWPRTFRAAFFGFAIHAPTSHLHFNFLEWMTIRTGVKGLAIPVFKAFMEQFVYWSWVSNSMYHAAMGAMQGMNGQQIYDRIADVLWDTQKAQWVFWIPVQLLNFQFVPVRHQLNVVLTVSVVWTALLSAWYPPQKDEAKEELAAMVTPVAEGEERSSS